MNEYHTDISLFPLKVTDPDEQCHACWGTGRLLINPVYWCADCGESGRRSDQLRITRRNKAREKRLRDKYPEFYKTYYETEAMLKEMMKRP